MAIPTFHITISGSILAAYAAVLSTLTATAQIVQFWRDRADVKVRVRHGMEILYDRRYSGKSLTIVYVVNRGRRPVTINSVGGIRLFPLDPFVFRDCMPSLPHELTEGKSLMAILATAEIDLNQMDTWEAYDVVGRTHSVRASTWFEHWRSRFRWRRESNRLRRLAKPI